MKRYRVPVLAGVVVSLLVVALRHPSRPPPIPVAEPLVVTAAFFEESDQLGRNETLSHLFARHNITGNQFLQLLEEARQHGLNPRRIQPSVEFDFRRAVSSPTPYRVETRLSSESILALTRDSTGLWSSSRVPIAWIASVETVEGQLIGVSSLNDAIHQRIPDSIMTYGERDRLIWNAAENVYGWVIDFTRDLRPGDRFKIVYERLQSERGEIQYGRVLAADLEAGGKSYTAYLVTDPAGNGMYFDADGRSLHRAFLKYPVQFRRISGVFSANRLHPILGVRRPHLGYDFAANTGTPIRATGDGVVRMAGVNGGAGLMVAIRHPKNIETRYFHMSRLATGIRSGTRVAQGQTIGYVGTSGLANGPHVHYEFLKNGKHINYRNVDLGDGEPIADGQRADFEELKQRFDQLLYDALARGGSVIGR